MATFAPQPSEFEYPYYDARVAYDNSLEAAITKATARVDNTAGRAIYTWDDTQNRETLISYESGVRDMSGLLINGWVLGTGGQVLLSRSGRMVSLYFRSLDGTDASSSRFLDNIPSGFRAPRNTYLPTYLPEFHVTVRRVEADIAIPSGRRYGDQYNGIEVSWMTVDPAPTNLPGTASGTIPFN